MMDSSGGEPKGSGGSPQRRKTNSKKIPTPPASNGKDIITITAVSHSTSTSPTLFSQPPRNSPPLSSSLTSSPHRGMKFTPSPPRASETMTQLHLVDDVQNPPELAQFAAAVADAQAMRRKNSDPDDLGDGALRPLSLLKRPSFLSRQPSAPDLVKWDVESLSNTSSSATSSSSILQLERPLDRPQHHVTFSQPTLLSPGFGPRGQSVPVLTSLTLDGSTEATAPTAASISTMTWNGQGNQGFNHLQQRPSSELFPSFRPPILKQHSPTKVNVLESSVNTLNEPLLYNNNESPSPPSDHTALEREMSAKRNEELVSHSKGLGTRQLLAMLRKNWLLKKRNPGQFICEMLSPLLMVLVIVIGWIFSLNHIDNFPDETFANDTAIVEEVFEWVIGHIIPIPVPGAQPMAQPLHSTRTPMSRFVHRRENEPGFVYGRSREAALRAGLESEEMTSILPSLLSSFHSSSSQSSHFMSSMSPFSALRSNGDTYSFVYQSLSSSSIHQPYHRQSHNDSFSLSNSLTAAIHDPPPPPEVICFPLKPLPGKQFCYDPTDKSLIEKMLQYDGPIHIPRFDEFVTAHLVLNQLLNDTADTFSDLNTNLNNLDQLTTGQLANLIFLGKMYFTPDIPAVHALVQDLNNTYQLFDEVFTGVVSDEDTAIDLALANVDNEADRTFAILVFNELDLENGLLDYVIRMNSSVLPTTKSSIDQFEPGIDDDYKKYYYSGFLTIQIMIEELALNKSMLGAVDHGNQFFGRYSRDDLYGPSPSPLNPEPALYQTIMGIPFPVLHYEGNSFYITIGPLVGLVFCMSMLYPTSRLIKGIVEEKETKTKETMKMMGLKDWVFNGSWFITFFGQFLVTATALVLLLHFTMLPRTSPSLLFCFFVCFFLSEITLGFLITVFFSKAKLAGILGPILLFAATMPRYAFFSKDANSETSPASVFAKTICSIFSPTAFTFGADLLVKYEGANLSLGWDNLTDDAFSMGRVLLFLIFDFILYALLAWYLDHVMPNEYGQRLHPLFCCRKSFWRDHVDVDYENEANDDENDGALVEPVAPSLYSQARVHIKKLRKQFTEGRGKNAKTTTAVHGLDLTLYEGQITALLGHNGAGKSTTISMLTGLIAPTSGDCSIHGYSILKNMKEIRKSLGICPQVNVLFGKITVQEHLELYAILKGVKTKDVASEVKKKIEEVGLTDKKDIYSSALSGGMQRRLQLCMAFIGDSKVVFLDEPTSGMDPYSRRSTWELLRNAKKDRVIVLTTHFMDEADLLGDRIAIMSEGKLRCCGSSLFLKSHYGIGYNLTLVKANKKCRTEQVSKMVMFFCPEAKVLSTAGGEMSYRLPWSSVSQFPGLLEQLEERRHYMGIGGYGISQTTLEEVFMRCAQIGDPTTSLKEDIEDSEGHHPFAALEGKPLRKNSGGSRPGSRKVSDAQAIASGSPSRNNNAFRSPSKTNANTVASPSKIASAIDSSINVDNGHTQVFSSLSAEPNKDESTVPMPDSLQLPPRTYATLTGQFLASFQKRYICAMRDLSGRFFEVGLPVLVVALVLLILKLNGPGDASSLLMKGEMYSGGGLYSPIWYSRETGQRIEPGTLYSMQHARGITDPNNILYDMIPQDYTNSVQMQDALLATYESHLGQRYGALVFNDSIYTHFNYSGYNADVIYVEHPPLSLMHNSSFFHCLPVLVAEVAEARWNSNRWLLAAQQGRLNPANLSQVNYVLHNHPIPLTANESLRTKTYLTLFAALFILIPFCYLPASFVLFVVKERSVKSKHLQFVSGLNPNIYWLSTLAFDMVNYLFVAIAVMLVMLAYSNDQFTGSFTAFSATFLLFLEYGLASIPLAYCYSFCFGNYTSAQVGIAGLNFLTGFVLAIGSFMLDNLGSTQELNTLMKNFYRIFPSFTLGEGLINMATRNFFALIHFQPSPSPFAWEVIGRNLTYLGIEAVVFMTITLLLESNFVHRMIRYLFNLSGELADPGPERVEKEDEDVAAERARVQKLRIRIRQPTHDGHYAFHGLSSPLTPGISLKGNIASATPGSQPHDWSQNASASPPDQRFDFDLKMSRTANKYSDTFNSFGSTKSTDQSGSMKEALLSSNDRSWISHEEKLAEKDDTKALSKSFDKPTIVYPLPPLQRGDSAASLHSNGSHASSFEDGVLEEEEDILLTQHLRKVYPARGGGRVTVAVDNLSLGIPRGQVFGFLGINGAGKTTTMKMLTGDIPISKGRAFINGFSVGKQLNDVRKEIGYAPQWDPLLPDLTARETLTMYAKIHGLPEDTIYGVVDNLLTSLGLGKFADKICGPYSGGNKRKLSLAIALIGDPSVVFLDEPSTGMDPVSRRFMWSVIESISDGRSVILTTHSMEECEALCSRIGIMVSGALQCLGSVQHLKSRFGMGYLMEISTNETRVDQVKAFVAKSYPGSTLDESHAGRLKYRLPQQGISLSSVFSSMESNKKSLEIVDYSISQCSLESIFIQRVKEHDQKEHEAKE